MSSTFDEMIDLARRLGLPVRHARLGGAGGGLATIKGVPHLFVDLDAEPEDQIEQTAKGLARAGAAGGLDNIYVRPDVRVLLEQYVLRS